MSEYENYDTDYWINTLNMCMSLGDHIDMLSCVHSELLGCEMRDNNVKIWDIVTNSNDEMYDYGRDDTKTYT